MENELRPELLGITGLNSFCKHNASSRSVMFGSHVSQRLVIDQPSTKRIQSGLESEFSKYTFNIKMPEDGKILNIIERYPRGMGEGSLNFNPETLIIYEKESNKELDCFTIPYHVSYHQYFGFKYVHNDNISLIKPGAFIGKDTVFADSNSVGENNDFKYGVNLETAYMTLPSVSEDGFCISDAALDKLKFKIYETRVVEFGSRNFPLNIYGNINNYKPFPDIGERLDETRGDGLLMVLRNYDDYSSVTDMSVTSTMEPDFIFDKSVYVRGGNGRVVDVKVIANNSRSKRLPTQMTEQLRRYEKAYLTYHQEIVATEERKTREHRKKYGGGKVKLSPKLHRLLVESLAVTNHRSGSTKEMLNLLYKQAPIDEYRVEFTIEYDVLPTTGFKLTDLAGMDIYRR